MSLAIELVLQREAYSSSSNLLLSIIVVGHVLFTSPLPFGMVNARSQKWSALFRMDWSVTWTGLSKSSKTSLTGRLVWSITGGLVCHSQSSLE